MAIKLQEAIEQAQERANRLSESVAEYQILTDCLKELKSFNQILEAVEVTVCVNEEPDDPCCCRPEFCDEYRLCVAYQKYKKEREQ